MSIAINIFITLGNCLAPVGTTFEVNVLDVGASIDDVCVNTLTTILGIEVLVEVAEA